MSMVHIVDDSPDVRALLKGHCDRFGLASELHESGESFIRGIDKLGDDDVVLLDIMMPDSDGYEILAEIREEHATMPVIMVTSVDDKESVIRCLRLGATDYITKPIDPVRLEASLINARRTGQLSERLRNAEETVGSLPGIRDFIARAPAMVKVVDLAKRVKDSEATILVTGESGTGKEVLARALHYQSKRSAHPFVAINCAAIPPSLMESELFGHEAGAFTGADKMRKGKFEAAGNGTVFLDEVGEMPLESQVRFLRVLQERSVVRVGGSEEIPVSARVICATNRDLDSMVKEGTFREDLLYRINTFPLELPPLRNRREDIVPLIDLFLSKYSEQEAKLVHSIEPEAIEALESYDWPGNIRQLENVIERAVLLCDTSEITLDTLPQDIQSRAKLNSSGAMNADDDDDTILPILVENVLDASLGVHNADMDPGLKTTLKVDHSAHPQKLSTGRIDFGTPERIVPLARIERSVILAALKVCKGDISEAARRLEVSRGWVYRRLRSFNIDPNQHRE